MKQIFTLCLFAFLGTTILNAQAPTITSFTPLTAKPCDAVTLTGTGFNTTVANNIVFCGATKAIVTAATATSITFTVPSGATLDYIKLLNKATNLATSSKIKFTPTYSPAKTGITSSDFSTKVDFAASSSPEAVAIGDLDGDGKADLVVVNASGVKVFRNTTTPGIISTSSFDGVDFAAASNAKSIVIADIDLDGKPDMVVGYNASSGQVSFSIYRNTTTQGSIGANSFAARIDFTSGDESQNAIVADFDSDGKPDILSASGYTPTNIIFYRNTSSPGNLVAGNFTISTIQALPFNNPYFVDDFNADGKPDLAMPRLAGGTGTYFLRNTSSSGSISFAARANFIANTQSSFGFATADFDGDGKQDIISIGNNSGSVSVLRNISSTSAITFSTKVDLATNYSSYSAAVGDLDGDGKPDFVAANYISNIISVFRNKVTTGINTNSFATKVDFTTSTEPHSIAIGDLDGDGRPDLVTSNYASGTISVFRNTGAVTSTNNSGTFTTAACGSYTWAAKGNKVYTASNNTDTIHLTNACGCDSLVTLDLTIKPASSSTTNTSICPSALPYSWNGSRASAGTYTFTTTNSQGCDSVATLNLTLKTNTTSITNTSICPSQLPYSWNGSRTAAGTYTFTTTNSQGCDSVATLNLTVKTNTTSTTNASICPSALPYSWNGSRTAAGTYTFTTTNSQGCDSVATLNLTIKTNTTSTTNTSICPSQLPYSWNGSRTGTGTYTFSTTNSQGCDSVATLNLTVKTNTTSTANISICSSELPYSWNGSRTAAGTYTFTTTNSVGCDSTATLNLTIKSNYIITASAGSNGSISNVGASSICEGNNQSYTITPNANYHIVDVLVNGVSQGAITTYTFSNVTANNTIAASFAANCIASTSSTTQTACASYVWGGTTYTASGDYVKHFTNICGMDSAATLHLTINAATSSTQTASVCSNQLPFSWNGLTFTAAGTQTKTGLSNSKGCDSSATLTLSVATASTPTISVVSTTNNVCSGILVTFTATATNEGTAPIYQWKKNGVNVGLNTNTYSSPSLVTNDSIWCVLTSNSACATTATATSNKIKMTVRSSPLVSPVKNNVSVNITTLTLCTIGVQSTLYNAYLGGTWSSSNPSVATAVNGPLVTGVGISSSGLLTAVSNGITTVTYTVTSGNGCPASASATIFVDAVPTLNAITSASNGVCIGGNITLSNTSTVPFGGSAVWASTAGRATINATTGVVTGINAGTGSIKYTITNANGCSNSTTSSIAVNSLPNIPSINYAAGTVNPQTGAGGAYCNNRTFTVVGSPTGGVWSTTNALVVTVTSAGLAKTVGVGTSSIVYTYTNANGCSNSRSIVGNVAACVPRGVNGANNEKQETRNEFSMYPNPAKSFIRLNVETLIGAGTIVVTDLYGKQVKTQSLSMGTNAIDVSSFAKGIYFVSTITNEGKTTRKLVVE